MINQPSNTPAAPESALPVRQPLAVTRLYAAIVLFVLPVLITIFNAHYSRMLADDYQYPGVVQRLGLWGSVLDWYNRWTGNYSSSFVLSLMSLFEPPALGWLLSLITVLWFIGTCWLVYEVALRMGWPRPRLMGLLFGSLLMVTAIDSLFNIYDTLYWASGGINHVIPLVGVIFFLAFLSRLMRLKLSNIAITIVSFLMIPYFLLMAGFSSPSTAHMLVLLGMVIALVWRCIAGQPRRVALPVLITALLTSFVALILITIAPGTAIRQTFFPPSPGLFEFAKLTVSYTLAFTAAQMIVLAPASILLTLLIMGWAGYRLHPQHSPIIQRYRYRLMAAILLAALVLIASAFSTGAYAMSTYLPARANTTPAYTLIMAIAACGYIMGVTLRGALKSAPRWQTRFYGAAVVLLLILGPGLSLLHSLNQTQEMAAFNRDWNAIHEQLRAAVARGEQDVVVNRFSFDLGEMALDAPLGANPDASGNRDLAGFYHLNSVTAR